MNGYPVTGVKVPLLELQSHSSSITAGENQRHCSLEVNLPWIVKYRLTILFCCAVSGMLFLILATSLLSASRMDDGNWLKLFSHMPFYQIKIIRITEEKIFIYLYKNGKMGPPPQKCTSHFIHLFIFV